MPPRAFTAAFASSAALALLLPSALGCSTFLVGKDASSDGSLFVTHSDDGEGNPDARLSYVPPADHAPGSMRPVWPDLEDNPRYVGDHRGDTYLPGVSVPPDTPPTEPIGHIPQVPHTFGYSEGNYGIMNEHQLSIGESTCSGRFVASAISAGGEALFCVNELSRVAMERCSTARCAIRVMGDLAVEHGFYGAAGSFEGGSETLLIADTEEGWVMHFVPYPETNSAVWVAQRVPDDEVAVVMNMFVIREVNSTDEDNFAHSDNMIPVARKHGLWDPDADGPFDFTRAYSAGEYAHKYYSGRRLWGAFRLVDENNPLPAQYGDLRVDAPYPFSVKPSKPVTAKSLFAWHRDWYAGTPFDMTRGLAAGPWGSPDRFNGGDAEASIPGAFERPIALHRTTYTHVLQTRRDFPDGSGGIMWYAPHAAHGSCFVPVLAGLRKLPRGLVVGNASVVDRDSQWWAHRYAHNVAQLKYSAASEAVRDAQARWEDAGAALVARVDAAVAKATKEGIELDVDEAFGDAFDAHAEAVRRAWWDLADDIVLRLADGFITDPASKEPPGKAAGYPAWWLEKVGWREGPPPPPPPPENGWGRGLVGGAASATE